ncbi:hypothetical protein KVT40_001259 [Elsinoe batatas]|uniref:Shikimate dehydrogenase substrate binding N-terminal domain-containing protein n=1 Tax=Elsinoe batatas TaxID=2601811 RepID=A0A8K0L9A9_9PEZI|nr:hypothetical protein KVT40_001259 [Elsinoe batatas]
MAESEKTLHLVGVGVTHSIAPAMHNFIAESLGLPWKFYSTECPTLNDALALARDPSTAGLVVTMPYKTTVMPELDELDDLAISIGACNNVYYRSGNPRRLCGTNTDWIGIKGCLSEKSNGDDNDPSALVVGAGGASRAAVYALVSSFNCTVIYILNRDDDEVSALISDSKKLPVVPSIVHVKTLDQAHELQTPTYIVGTVPDFEPHTATEKLVVSILECFLKRQEKGVLLDMCFKPRRTRMIKLAESLDWHTVEGTHVIGYQIEEQWRLWAGQDRVAKLDRQGAWKVLLKSADESAAINF